jgi:uracil phosphoribosyltransferase
MLKDSHYLNPPFVVSEIPHEYGENVHLLNDPVLSTTLARLCSLECTQPVVNQLLGTLYRDLIRVVANHEFPQADQVIETRMAHAHPEGKFTARILDATTKAVCVNLARAGTLPSHLCYDYLNYLLEPSGLRQDHISINRKIDHDERVIGTNLGGVKIGGDISDRFVLFPDPMGATGSTILAALDIYKDLGKPKRFIALHLIVTPEYLQALKPHAANLSIYAIRLDRGLSPAKVLSSVPGSHWREEIGLNGKQYIVPGGGGLGEVINNSYV